jgi:Ca2+-binding RTX toxin-like protein
VLIVDSTGDVVVEETEGGSDTVHSTVDFVLDEHVEDLVLLDARDIDGWGNDGDNSIKGSRGDNLLKGEDGNDKLDGHRGDDTVNGGAGDDKVLGNHGDDLLYGKDGNDTLDGFDTHYGADTLVGGDGDDVYFARLAFDVVIEAADGGYDILYSEQLPGDPAWLLPDHVEKLIIHGGGNASGNDMDNEIVANGLSDRISGRGGNDTIDGGGGHDTIRGGSGDDLLKWNGWYGGDAFLDGGSGIDTLELGSGLHNGISPLFERQVVTDIERISLVGEYANTLKLGEADVLAMSSGNTLTILGESDDTVDIESDFTAGDVSDGFRTYTVGTATLLIDTDITNVA